MADKQKDFNKDKGMSSGSEIHDKGSHRAPGRDAGDNLSTSGRTGAGQNPQNNPQKGFDREDREREQPGSKQTDRGQNN